MKTRLITAAVGVPFLIFVLVVRGWFAELVIALLASVHTYGADGVAWAVALAGAVFYLTMGLMVRYTLRQLHREEPMRTADFNP